MPNLDISSAGLHALVGHDIDPDTRQASSKLGLALGDHVARRFDASMGRGADLILVLDRGHLNEMRSKYPEFTGKCFLLRHHFDMQDVPDPYRLGLANHYRAIELILEGAFAWAKGIEKLK